MNWRPQLDRSSLKDLAVVVLATLGIAVIAGGIWVGITAAGASSQADTNHGLILQQCRKDLKQDHQLAALVRAAKHTRGQPTSTLAVFDAYLNGVKKENCNL